VRWQLKSSREWPGAVSTGNKNSRDDKEWWKEEKVGEDTELRLVPC
jgi:hypothetical protein